MESMAPVLAIAGMVTSAVPGMALLTPLRRFSKPFVIGPNLILISDSGARDGDSEEVMAKPEGEERMDLASAIGGSGTGGGPSACGIDVGNSAHYISVRRDAVDDDAVAHVDDAIEVHYGLRVVSDHDDGLAEVLVEAAKHFEDDF
jgi:hypothetical protein